MSQRKEADRNHTTTLINHYQTELTLKKQAKRESQRRYFDVIAQQAAEKRQRERDQLCKMTEGERRAYERGLQRLQDSPLMM